MDEHDAVRLLDRDQLVAMGLEVVASTPAEFAAYIDAESKKWGKLIREAKIQVD